jgi:hypothetical protein
MSEKETTFYVFLFLIMIASLAVIGMVTIGKHLFPKTPEVEDEFTKRTRELVEARLKYENAIKAYPEEEDLLTQLFETQRLRIVEREYPKV